MTCYLTGVNKHLVYAISVFAISLATTAFFDITKRMNRTKNNIDEAADLYDYVSNAVADQNIKHKICSLNPKRNITGVWAK